MCFMDASLACWVLLLKKYLVSVSGKEITWGRPLVIAPYNESVGPRSFDSSSTFSLPDHGMKGGRHDRIRDLEGIHM